eukprot:7391142-Prymnesium_polylepis.1
MSCCPTRGIHVGTRRGQHGYERRVPVLRCEAQRRAALTLTLYVDVSALVQQLLDRLMVAVARRLQQRHQSAATRDLQVARARAHRSEHSVQPVDVAQHRGSRVLHIGGPGSVDGAGIDKRNRRRLVLPLQRRV